MSPLTTLVSLFTQGYSYRMKKKDVLEYLKRNQEALSDEVSIKWKVPIVKKTFEIEEEILERFLNEAKERKLKIKVAVNEALSNWIEKK